jgi:UDPglucose 6-dehydrogenase
MKIGIIGFGFVGKSLVQGFVNTKGVEIKIYDIKESVDTFEDVIESSEIIFLCLPTPMERIDGGKIDLSIIDSVIEKINSYIESKDIKDKKILVLRSTIVPGSTRKYAEKYPKLGFVFNPEFLTERSARLDFINTARIILGGNDEDVIKVAKLYRMRFLSTPIYVTNFETAEFVKYFCNNFFAIKVSYFNEQYLVVENHNDKNNDKSKIDWNKSIELLLADGRIGNSHYQVPGHDGQLGFGGKCFPKDICAYREWAKEEQSETPILDSAWEMNKKIRDKWDWTEIDGAVSKKDKND